MSSIVLRRPPFPPRNRGNFIQLLVVLFELPNGHRPFITPSYQRVPFWSPPHRIKYLLVEACQLVVCPIRNISILKIEVLNILLLLNNIPDIDSPRIRGKSHPPFINLAAFNPINFSFIDLQKSLFPFHKKLQKCGKASENFLSSLGTIQNTALRILVRNNILHLERLQNLSY